MKILLIPNYDSVRDDMGYGENDDYNSDAVLFQQGFETDSLDIDDGETFRVPEKYLGQIVDDGNMYEMAIEVIPGDWHKGQMLDGSTIDPGLYKLDGHLIIEIESKESW